MIIAIHKQDGNRWIPIKARFPMETEVLEDFYLIEVKAPDLATAVRIAKIQRARVIMREGENGKI